MFHNKKKVGYSFPSEIFPANVFFKEMNEMTKKEFVTNVCYIFNINRSETMRFINASRRPYEGGCLCVFELLGRGEESHEMIHRSILISSFDCVK